MQINAQNPKIFVGYINNYPVFNEYNEKKVYILKDTIEEFFDYPKTYSLRAIKNNFRCYTENTKKETSILLFSDNKEEKYLFEENISFVVLSKDGTIFFTDKSGEIKCIIDNEIKTTGFQGYCIDIVDSFLYYSYIHDPEILHANADIFEVNIKALEYPHKLIDNVAGEATVIIPKKYIYDVMLMDGGFKPIIYNVEKGIYKLISKDKGFPEGPFYSYQEDALIFYNAETLEFRKVDIYSGW